MLKKASGRAAAAMGCGGDPPAPPKVPDGRPASRLLSTRSLPGQFTDSAMSPASVAELSRTRSPPCSSGGRNGGRSGGGIGGGSAAAAGLAGVLVAEEEEAAERGSYKNSRRVLLGMRLRVQLPPPPPPGKAAAPVGGDLPGSPIEFGVKNRDAQLALLSPVQRSPLSSAAARLAAPRRRSEVEEELAGEDYTCVIARGPNPRMTHIFEDRVVESRAGAGAGGGGGGAACCFLSNASCSACNKDAAALLLKRGEREFCSNQWNEEALKP